MRLTNALPLVVTVVIGTKGANVSKDYQTNVRVQPQDSGLPMETVFLCFQIRSLDKKRFPPQPAGRLTNAMMSTVEQVVRACLGL